MEEEELHSIKNFPFLRTDAIVVFNRNPLYCTSSFKDLKRKWNTKLILLRER